MTALRFLIAVSLTALAGCRSYDIVQSNVFSDEDGRLLRVDYGRSESDHVNTFRSPMTGREMEFKSNLLVKVFLPWDDDFVAWQCMNYLRSGTMYRTDDGEWMFHANGFSCAVYLREENDPTRYREMYRGILCDASNVDRRRHDKWRDMKKDAWGIWR